MDLTLYFNEIMKIIGPCLALAGMLDLVISLITLLISILINAATGKGIRL